ncbi:iron-siderophore ABC transporter substrate-binding protein [Patulibacter minatonensis]|uniref:iron-siderophore ABC transporter substrate-binding protein n=1 Tax=Patulibacter minatonensis TaxID=298163 RepID=UPI000562594B|nr:iron-siderophore ABC transporter substrate-binding protein [Patulibacter minatonensis]
MRRLLLLPALLLALALGACGSDDSDDPTTTGAASAAGSGFPITVTHARGTTTIEQEPKRIVTVGLRDQDTLLALDIKAVGAMDWFQQGTFAKWPWENWGGSPPQVVSNGGFEVNFEKVAALRPDLILGIYQEINAADYKKLSAIAPTVAQSAEYKAYTTPWREETRSIAETVGRKEQAEKLIGQVDERFAKVRAAHPEYKTQEAMIIDPSQGFYAFSSTDPRGQFLKEMGFTSSTRIDKLAKGEFGTDISQERLKTLDVDRLFVLIDKNTRKKVFDNKAFANLDVVKEGRVIEVPYYDAPQTGAAVAFNSVHSLPYAIDGMQKLIDANVAKAPIAAK